MMKDARLDWATEWVAKKKTCLIQNEWHEGSGAEFEVINPATSKPLGTFRMATSENVDTAVAAARTAFHAMQQDPPSKQERRSWLLQIASLIREKSAELATLEALANGKLYREALFDDLPGCSDVFEHYAGWIDKLYGDSCPVESGFTNYTRYEPLGVCSLIVPWNFPLLLACWKIAPALAMGNTVIVKPSEYTSYSFIRLMELVTERKLLPPGVLQFVLGDGTVGELLSNHLEVDKVSFTGSTAVGKEVVTASGASNLKKVTLELGGKSPVILFSDTENVEGVVSHLAKALFSHKGEKCSEPTRFFIQQDIYEEVVSLLAKRADAIRCGDPFASDSQQGPQCYRGHFERVLEYIECGNREGAIIVAGGVPDTTGHNQGGLYIRPTVFRDVHNDMRIAREEIFGPVLCAIPFADEYEAVTKANDSTYGLAAGVYSRDARRCHRVAEALEAGMVFVNRYGCYDLCSPFGGIKQSGWGREMGRAGLLEYARLKSVWIYHGGECE